MLSVQPDDRVLDIGCGTGKLIHGLAEQAGAGYFEGIDFSDTMIAKACRKNRKNIQLGKVKIIKGDFDEMPYENSYFNKVSSVNTIYFWPNPETTARKVSNILKPGGLFIVAFEDIEQLKKKKLNQDRFRFYSADDVKALLANSGFSDIKIKSKSKGEQLFHCVVAGK